MRDILHRYWLLDGDELGQGVFNSACEKVHGRCLETQDCCASDLFAPKLIHEPRNCSKLYSCEELFIRGHQRLTNARSVQMCTVSNESFELDHSMTTGAVDQSRIPTLVGMPKEGNEKLDKCTTALIEGWHGKPSEQWTPALSITHQTRINSGGE
jgi:hypothetical protein